VDSGLAIGAAIVAAFFSVVGLSMFIHFKLSQVTFWAGCSF
jgi:hypothetical protein